MKKLATIQDISYVRLFTNGGKRNAQVVRKNGCLKPVSVTDLLQMVEAGEMISAGHEEGKPAILKYIPAAQQEQPHKTAPFRRNTDPAFDREAMLASTINQDVAAQGGSEASVILSNPEKHPDRKVIIVQERGVSKPQWAFEESRREGDTLWMLYTAYVGTRYAAIRLAVHLEYTTIELVTTDPI